MSASKPVVKTFEAMLERGSNNLGWTIIRVPLDVGKVWGSRGHLRVSGEINGFPFRSALFPTRHGYHMLLVNKKMQKGANARLGMNARFRLQPDTAPREIALPQELLRVLNESRRLRKYFDSFTPSQRQDIARRIAEGKHSETRQRRALQFAERLMQAMEAERELPPLIERALAQNP